MECPYEHYKLVTISAAHISSEDAALLKTSGFALGNSYGGWLISCSEEVQEFAEQAGFSLEFISLLIIISQHADYLLLAVGGRVYENLPTFDW